MGNYTDNAASLFEKDMLMEEGGVMDKRPAQRQCKECVYFDPKSKEGQYNGYCKSIESDVEPFWRGCIINKIREHK